MLDRTLAAASADSPTIGGMIGFAILLIIAVGILVKLIIVLTRRGKTGVKEEVLGPVFKSGGVQSELYGFKPTEGHHLKPGKRFSTYDDSDRNI